MSDYPYTKENHVLEQSRRTGGELLDMSKNLYQMRQLAIATIVSVPEDHVLYTVNILNAGTYKKDDAYLLAHPNYWNIVGYPKVNDLVLVMHQRMGGDAHIIMKLQDKLKPILDDEELNNPDGVETGTLMP